MRPPNKAPREIVRAATYVAKHLRPERRPRGSADDCWQQDEEDDEEEEERRIAWIQHYVKAGELERAVELGWDGVDWRTNERLVEVLPPDEGGEGSPGGRGRPRPRSRASLLRVTSEQAEAEARAAPSPSGSAVHASSLTRI